MHSRELKFIVTILVLPDFLVCSSSVEFSHGTEPLSAQPKSVPEIISAKASKETFAKLGFKNPGEVEKSSIAKDHSEKLQPASSLDFERKLGQPTDEKAFIRQALEQFEKFKKTSRQRALDQIRSLEEKTESLAFLTSKNGNLEVDAPGNMEKPLMSLDHNKIDSKNPPSEPEFTDIAELTIKNSGDGLEPLKLDPLNEVKKIDRRLELPVLKRGTFESRKKVSPKIGSGNGFQGIPKIQKPSKTTPSKLGKENRDVKNSIHKTAGTLGTGIAKAKRTPLLKRDTEDLDKNRVPKINRTFEGALNKTLAVKLTGNIEKQQTADDQRSENAISDVKIPLLKPAPKESSKIARNETTKPSLKRRISAPNMVYHLDAECVAFPSERTRSKFLEREQFIPRNVMINRVQFSGDRAYVAMPKLKRGVPFSVGKVSLAGGPRRELRIEAFPSWAIHRYANISGIVNAVDIFAEEGTLWILDSGVVSTLENPERLAPPKVFAVDLVTEQVIKAIDLSNFVDKTSRLQHLVVESGPYDCRFVYISDAASRGLIIWDVCHDFGSKIILPRSTQPEVAVGPDILYLGLVTRGKMDLLAVTFLGAERLFGIPTYSLQNLKFGTMTGDVTNMGLKPRKLVILAANQQWMYFRFVASGDVYAWDVGTDFKEENFKKLRTGGEEGFATQVAVGHKRMIWALESNFQDYGKQGKESGLVFSIRAICKISDVQFI
ncbi:unnamed protein product [Bemisia tabaci]|uniref:Uncharacterized protein n=1 Tax=Bemisia tabaci TaxID=7038 RepID=A0A9P0A4G5_BEMTA|nr:unnamed protein product [Bemisia tabaci]